MFFSNNKTLVYIKRNTLEFFHGGDKQELTIPVTILQNLEITDTESFEKILREFLLKLKFKKHKALIVLSEGVLFQKEVTSKDEEDLNEKYQKFRDSLPVSSDKIAIRKIKVQEKNLFFAVNKKIYQEVSAGLEQAGWEIKGVVPVTLFKEYLNLEEDELSASSAKKILSSKDLIKVSDFLSETQDEEIIKKSPNYKFFVFLSFGFILVFAVSILLGIRFNLLSFPGFTVKENIQKKEVEETVPSGEATTSASVEEYLSISVLNGSGIAGQAGKIKTAFEELGYKNIEVGNAESIGTKTTLSFSKDIKEKDKVEVKNKLDEIFAEVEEQEGSKDSEFDVVITTGTYIQ